MTDPVTSPCVRICCLDDDNICIGCGRTLDEIRCWSDLPEPEKRGILLRATARRIAREARYPIKTGK